MKPEVGIVLVLNGIFAMAYFILSIAASIIYWPHALIFPFFLPIVLLLKFYAERREIVKIREKEIFIQDSQRKIEMVLNGIALLFNMVFLALAWITIELLSSTWTESFLFLLIPGGFAADRLLSK